MTADERMSSLSGGRLYLVDQRYAKPPTHARRDCRELDAETGAVLEPVLVPYGVRPPKDWQPCEVCGGAAPARAGGSPAA